MEHLDYIQISHNLLLVLIVHKLTTLKFKQGRIELRIKLDKYITPIQKILKSKMITEPVAFNYISILFQKPLLKLLNHGDLSIVKNIFFNSNKQANEYVRSVGKSFGSTSDTLTDIPDIYTPFTFSEILTKEISISISDFESATTLTNLNRYIFSVNNTYISTDSNYNIDFNNDFSSYSDVLTKIFQVVQESASSTKNFRINSDLHYVESLDYDSTTGKLVFKNNWGINASANTGYICFTYVNKLLQAKTRYIYNADYTHSLDPDFIYADYYVYYDESSASLQLTNNIDGATSFKIYNSPINVSIPFDFNPTYISYQPNDTVPLSSEWLTSNRNNLESTSPSEPNNKFHKNFSNTSNAGYNYTLQLTNVGYDDSTNGTNYYADQMLSEIYSKVNGQGNSLRYSTDVYKAFREGALKNTLGCNSIANGDINMNTVPYVYFTNEKDDSGKYHPFMCIASYNIPGGQNYLLDVCRPPGDGSEGGYPQQNVTRDATLITTLYKIPMMDYGTVDSINGKVYFDGTNTISEISGNYNDMVTTTAYEFMYNPSENDNGTDTSRYFNTITYNVYNYSSITTLGIAVNGVDIYPLLDNKMTTAHLNAEISPTGIHVSRSMNLHYHADGHSANTKNNIINLYNDFDYINRNHPPLIGFGVDGIALYGIYETDYSTMDGYNDNLDDFGGHSHDSYGYHYHCHTIVNNASNNIDTSLDGAVDYTIHALMKGAWKGNINNIPDFWDESSGPANSLSQTSQYVWGKNI